MPGKFKCTSCQREYTWKPELAGKRGKCKCGAAVTVPMEDPAGVAVPEESSVESQQVAEPPALAQAAAQVPMPTAAREPAAESIPVAPPAVTQVVSPLHVAIPRLTAETPPAQVADSIPVAMQTAVPEVAHATIPVSLPPPGPVAEAMPAAASEESSVAIAVADKTPSVAGQECCQICGAVAPTKHVEFHQNIGMLIMRRHRTLRGDLCKNCISENFWKMTGITLAVGWASTISLVLAPIFVVKNIIRYLSCRTLPLHSKGC